MKTILKGKNIIKSFGETQEKIQVLNNIDLVIKQGEFVSIMGPSGSGKSTLLYAISGMDRIDSGEISYNEQQLTKMKEQELADLRRDKMGFVFQQPTMLKNLSLIDNIILPALRKNKKMIDIEKRAESLMKKVGIQGLKDRKITQVSGGQLQRAGICRALINQPEIIFGDEPTGALNSKAAQNIMDILLKINEEGTTVVLVTHDVKVAAQSEKVLFMEDGHIVDNINLGNYMGKNLEERIERINLTTLAVEVKA